MSSISAVILLLIITSMALFLVSLINQRQMRARLINQKLNQMRRRVSELEELSATLETLVETTRVPKQINDEAIDIINTMIKVSPQNTIISMSLETAEQRANELSDTTRRVEPFRLMESDAAIAKTQYSLNEAARIVRKRQAAGVLQVAEMDAMLQELSWANFMVKVTSNIGQGHKAINRGDYLRAFAYYRKALEVATESGHRDDRQNQLISEIGELVNNKRKALSPSLMPETLYNPSADTVIPDMTGDDAQINDGQQ